MASDLYLAAADADAMLILTDSNEFAGLDLRRLRIQMRCPVIVDGRNLYHPKEMEAAGFVYHSVGRAPVIAVDNMSAIPEPAFEQIADPLVPVELSGLACGS